MIGNHFALILLAGSRWPLAEALPRALTRSGLDTSPAFIPIENHLKDTDTICAHAFGPSVFRSSGWRGPYVAGELVFSSDAQRFGQSDYQALFSCYDARRNLPRGEVQRRGPFVLTCREAQGEQIEFYMQMSAGYMRRKARCLVVVNEEQNKEPDTELKLSSVQSTGVKAGTTNCLSSIVASKDWLALGFDVWTSDMGSSSSTAKRLTTSVEAEDVTWALVGGPTSFITHDYHFTGKSFRAAQGTFGKTYRVCAKAALGGRNFDLNLMSLVPSTNFFNTLY